MTRLIIKALLLAGVGIVAAIPVLAADLPRRELPMPKAPVYVPFFSWNGIYLGMNAGYGFGKSSWTNPATGIGTGDFDISGALVGGTLGYNIQFSSVVVGVEGDFGWSGIKGTSTTNCPLGCQTSNPWLGTVRARLGYAFDRFLPYITAGGAFGEIRGRSPGINGISETKFGWTAGVGLEYAFMMNWSAKLEYLYVDLGTASCSATACAVATDITFTANVVRAGINYKF